MSVYLNNQKLAKPLLNGVVHNACLDGEKVWGAGAAVDHSGSRIVLEVNHTTNVPYFGIPVTGYKKGTLEYNWNIQINDEPPMNFQGTTPGYITFYVEPYTVYTVTITPVNLEVGWARAYGTNNQTSYGWHKNISIAVLEEDEWAFLESETSAGDYYKYYEYYLANITSVPDENLPTTVTTIGNYFRGSQFAQCPLLSSAPVESLPSTVTSIGNWFRGDQYYNSGITQAAAEVLPSTITAVGDYFRCNQFLGCTSLRSTVPEVLPSSVTSFGIWFRANQYAGCTSLTTPAAEALPSSITTISNLFRSSQYARCENLNTAAAEVLPSSVTAIGDSFRRYQYEKCTGMSIYAVENIPSTVQSIGSYFRAYQYSSTWSSTIQKLVMDSLPVTPDSTGYRTCQYDGNPNYVIRFQNSGDAVVGGQSYQNDDGGYSTIPTDFF
jgi:hypothetical protein